MKMGGLIFFLGISVPAYSMEPACWAVGLYATFFTGYHGLRACLYSCAASQIQDDLNQQLSSDAWYSSLQCSSNYPIPTIVQKLELAHGKFSQKKRQQLVDCLQNGGYRGDRRIEEDLAVIANGTQHERLRKKFVRYTTARKKSCESCIGYGVFAGTVVILALCAPALGY